MATKLRALYQRNKGRDLFDLSVALRRGNVSPEQVVAGFLAYMEHGGHRATRAQFEQNLHAKLRNHQFQADISPLLASDHQWEIESAAALVQEELIARLPGQAWHG